MAQHRLEGQRTVPQLPPAPAWTANVVRYFRAAPPAAVIFQSGLFFAWLVAVVHTTATDRWDAYGFLVAVLSWTVALAAVGAEVLLQRLKRTEAAHDATRLRLAGLLHAKPTGAPQLVTMACMSGGHRLMFRDGAWEDLGPAVHRREAATT